MAFKLNPLTLAHITAFRKRKLSWYSLIAIIAIFSLSLGAELLVNNRPVVMNWQSKLYFPVFKQYNPDEFGQEGTFVTDYREIPFSEEDWAIWPLVRWGPLESDLSLEFFPSPPSSKHLLGVDDKGRDLLARLLYGFRIAMTFALGVWLMSFSIGMFAGAVQGYFGGRVDFYGQRLSEIWSSVPTFFLLITISSIFTPNVFILAVLFAIFGWTVIAQYQRAEFLNLRRREFIEAARVAGASPWRIIWRHVMPNAITPIVTFTPFAIAGGITGIAALDYLGFGLQPPAPSWGELLRQALQHFSTAWWISVYTVGCMFGVLLLLVFINEGAREAFDPRKLYHDSNSS